MKNKKILLTSALFSLLGIFTAFAVCCFVGGEHWAYQAAPFLLFASFALVSLLLDLAPVFRRRKAAKLGIMLVLCAGAAAGLMI